MADPKKSRLSVGHSQYHLTVAGGCEAFGNCVACGAPTRYREAVLTVPKSGYDK